MTNLIKGKSVAAKILEDVRARAAKLKNQPKLAVVLVGDDKPSATYVGKKELAANDVGIDFELGQNSSLKKLVSKDGPLNYYGIKMAKTLDFPIGDLHIENGKDRSDLLDRISRMVEEFNEAITFTMNRS